MRACATLVQDHLHPWTGTGPLHFFQTCSWLIAPDPATAESDHITLYVGAVRLLCSRAPSCRRHGSIGNACLRVRTLQLPHVVELLQFRARPGGDSVRWPDDVVTTAGALQHDGYYRVSRACGSSLPSPRCTCALPRGRADGTTMRGGVPEQNSILKPSVTSSGLQMLVTYGPPRVTTQFDYAPEMDMGVWRRLCGASAVSALLGADRSMCASLSRVPRQLHHQSMPTAVQ